MPTFNALIMAIEVRRGERVAEGLNEYPEELSLSAETFDKLMIETRTLCVFESDELLAMLCGVRLIRLPH